MATHIKYIKKDAFSSEELANEMMSYVHVMNSVGQGEHTLCGMAFDGDGVGRYELGVDEVAFINTNDKITCPDCIKQIEFCKSIKASDYKKTTY